jgi:hypothetical protein
MTMRSAPAEEAHTGRRRHSRLRVCLPAKLVTLNGTFAVTLLDLSFRGAKLGLGAFAQPGGDAVLCWGRFEMFCRVAWCRGERCGLDFDEPLHPDVLIATRDLADRSSPADAARQAASAFVRGQMRL